MVPSAGVEAIIRAVSPSILTGWTLTRSLMPDNSPAGAEASVNTLDRWVTIYDSVGRNPDQALRINYPSVQIVVRGSERDYDVAYNKSDEIRRSILGIDSQPAQFPELISLLQEGDIAFMGRDSKNRPKFSMNFRLITQPEASSLDHRED